MTVVEAIRRQHPGCGISYASDNAAFPYGTKSELDLVDRVERVLHRLQEVVHPDIIVVACNTASTVALPKIREYFDIPVVGVVPAVKPAAALSQTRVIGLLATPGTVERPYTRQLIDRFANDCRVISVGSSDLVELAENKLRGEVIAKQSLASIVAPFKAASDLDTIVLACTHFPLLKTELMEALPDVTFWVDSGEAIARRVGYWLQQLRGGLSQITGKVTDNAAHNPKNHTSFFTANTPEVEALLPCLEDYRLGSVKFLTLQPAISD